MIPRRIRITPKVTYKIKFVKNLKDRPKGTPCYGICNVTDKEIYICYGLSKRERITTFIHELIHAIDFETFGRFSIHERSVRKLEEAIYFVLTQ